MCADRASAIDALAAGAAGLPGGQHALREDVMNTRIQELSTDAKIVVSDVQVVVTCLLCLCRVGTKFKLIL